MCGNKEYYSRLIHIQHFVVNNKIILLRQIFYPSGYTLNVKHDNEDWMCFELFPEDLVYTLDDLQCGSLYHIYLVAYNRVSYGSSSPIQTVGTKGGTPLLPDEKDFIVTNSTSMQLNLISWPDGGCPILQFSILYRTYNEGNWIIIAKSVSEGKIMVHYLKPAMWYQLKVTAENEAGTTVGVFNFATTTVSGGMFWIHYK